MAINEPKGRTAYVLLTNQGSVYKVFLCSDDLDADEAIEKVGREYAQELVQTDIIEIDTSEDLMEALENLNS